MTESWRGSEPRPSPNELPPLKFRLSHPHRRLSAIELNALPIHDVAAASGWCSVEPVRRIYQKGEASGGLKAVQSTGGKEE